MSRFAIFALVSLIVLMGCIVITPSAEAVPVHERGQRDGLGSIGCDLGPLHFSNFAVIRRGRREHLSRGLSQVLGASTDLTFQVSHSPSPATLADILFFYTVKTLTGLPTSAGWTSSIRASNVTIRETACATRSPNGVCSSGLLADYVVVGQLEPEPPRLTPLSVDGLYRAQGHQLLPDSFISEFTNSHEPWLSTPKPATLLLLGSSLTALGWPPAGTPRPVAAAYRRRLVRSPHVGT